MKKLDVWVALCDKTHEVMGVFINEEAGWDFLEDLCLKTQYNIDDFTMNSSTFYKRG